FLAQGDQLVLFGLALFLGLILFGHDWSGWLCPVDKRAHEFAMKAANYRGNWRTWQYGMFYWLVITWLIFAACSSDRPAAWANSCHLLTASASSSTICSLTLLDKPNRRW